MNKQVCENCEVEFEDEAEYYDLCPVCVGPYEEALAEARAEDRDVLRVPFPEPVRYWLCHYVRREDDGDLLWGYNWREAVLVEDGTVSMITAKPADIEACMYDKETGESVGDTRNFCINTHCIHGGCGPRTLIAEVL